jgi:O-antigen ligase
VIVFSKTRARDPIPMAARTPEGIVDRPIALVFLYTVMAISIVVAALIDVPRQRRLGSTTWLGAITVIECALGSVALMAARQFPRRVLTLIAPYAALMVWAALSMSWAPPRSQGLQNAAAYLSFLVLLTVAAVAATENRTIVERVLGVSIGVADMIGLGLVAASLAIRGWPTNIDTVPWFVHPRALALFGLVPLGWHLAKWVAGTERSAIHACLWVAAIFVSLSRTATAAALLLVLLAALLRARTSGIKVGTQYLLAALVPLVVIGVLTIAPFRARLFGAVTPRNGTEKLELRDSGRSIMWTGIIRSAVEAPIIGKGLGTSESVVSDTYYWVGHPHNDFLRIWHDLGAVGVVLLLSSFAAWARTLWRDWYMLRDRSSQPRVLQLAAMSALLSLVLGMLTDNSLVYGFVMAPTAVLVGAGLGARGQVLRRRRKRRERDPVGVSGEASLDDAGDGIQPELEQVAARFRVRKRKRRRLD